MADLALSLNDLPTHTTRAILEALLAALAPADAAVIMFSTDTGGVVMGEITVKADEMNLKAKVTALDSEGHETTFDEIPTWESSDTSVATCNPDPDGYSCAFSVGAPGSAVITVTGIENSSGTPVEIISVGTITVTSGDAVVGSVEFTV